MSAKPRSLLKLDQAYIAVGGREHLTLGRETDIMRVIALRISPRDAEVPSSTLSADEMQGAEFSTRSASSISRWDETGCASDRFESPLRPRSPSSRTPGMYPHGMPNTPNGGGTSPRISPSPLAGLLMAPLSVSSRGGSRPLNRWGQAAVNLVAR